MSGDRLWHESEFRTIIEDARARHAAVVSLMHVLDAQAIGLLRLYATLGIATASAALVGFGESPTVIGRPLAWGLASATIVLVTGALGCFVCLRPTRINLPGRDPDFWQWAMQPSIERSQVVANYLETLRGKAADNLRRNRLSSRALTVAKLCGVAAPLLALVTGLIARHCITA